MPRHVNLKGEIREAAEFAVEKGMGRTCVRVCAFMCEKHESLGGVGVDVVRYYVEA